MPACYNFIAALVFPVPAAISVIPVEYTLLAVVNSHLAGRVVLIQLQFLVHHKGCTLVN